MSITGDGKLLGYSMLRGYGVVATSDWDIINEREFFGGFDWLNIADVYQFGRRGLFGVTMPDEIHGAF